MTNAVNFIAHQLQAEFGVELEHQFPTLTYLGVPNVRYNIVFYAAIKRGYKVRH